MRRGVEASELQGGLVRLVVVVELLDGGRSGLGEERQGRIPLLPIAVAVQFVHLLL